MIITAPPSVVISVDEICTTSITISLNTSSPPECGNVSHNVTSTSGNVTINNTTNGTKYTIKELQNDTLYNITVTSTYSGGLLTKSRSRPVMPSLPKCKLLKLAS